MRINSEEDTGDWPFHKLQEIKLCENDKQFF